MKKLTKEQIASWLVKYEHDNGASSTARALCEMALDSLEYVSQPVAWQRGDGFSFISDESKRKYPDRSRDFTIPLCRCEPEQG